MSYTDAEMLMASQIAYMNANTAKPVHNVGELVDYYLNRFGTYDANTGIYTLKADVSGVSKSQFETAQNILRLSEQNNVQSWRHWNVVSTCDKEDTSGFYGCLIDTGDGNAIVGCRGSESYDANQVVKDWVIADVGRLNNELTAQQADATAYMEKLYRQYGDKYDSFSFTGHSLGGSLATHSAITAPEGMQDKIDKVISYDGPGFSEEYLEKHGDLIERIKEKLHHYEYSWVGSLLYQPDGIDNRVIKASDDKDSDSIITSQLWRHATYNVEFDADGNVIPGERGVLQNIFGPESKVIESFPAWLWGFLARNYPAVFVSMIEAVIIALGAGYVISVGEQIGKKLEEVVQDIKEKANELYNNYLSFVVSGDYEIHTGELCHIISNLEDAQHQIARIADEVDEVKRSLPYDSASAYYFKNSLFWTSQAISSEGKKAGKMAKAVDKALVKYNRGDQKVAEDF